MKNTLNQMATRSEAWADFLLGVIEKECAKYGWKVEYGHVSDGFCIIFADVDQTNNLPSGEAVQQLRLIPDGPETTQYYQE